MKTLHWYLTRQVLASLLLTVIVFTLVLLLGNVLKEIIALLVSRRITLVLVVKAVGLLLPYVMAYVLPFGMLTAVLLVFGRFSADHELTAARAGGISLVSLARPILLLSLLLSALSFAFNLWIAPRCRGAYKDMIFQLGARSVANLITEDRFIDEIPGLILYIGKKKENELEDVRLYTLKDDQITVRVSARRGTLKYDEAARTIQFELYDGISELRNAPEPVDPETFIGPPPPEKPSEWQPARFGTYTLDPVSLENLFRSERKPKLSEMSFPELLRERKALEARGVSSMPVRVQLHRQVAFSFASFAFALIGIPLAIQAHRRETTAGVAIALALVLVYYTFMIAAEALETHETLQPHLLMWAPDFLFELLGAFLLFRANRR